MSFHFRRTFLAGLLICMPLLTTLWLIVFVLEQIHQAATPVIVEVMALAGFDAWLQQDWAKHVAPVISVVLALGAVYVVGLVGGNVIGRRLLRRLERLLLYMPLIRPIYSSVRQFVQTFSKAQGRTFSRVVMVEYPRKGVWTLGLVTNTASKQILETVQQPELVSVFLPTTPNPTSGWLAFIPSTECMDLAMSVDDAFKLIISGGVLGASPPIKP